MPRRVDGFLVGMVAAVGLAWLWPGPGAEGGWLHPELLTKAGVALVFFLHGLALPFAALRAGTLRWPLHLVVQASTYLLFPLMGMALLALAGNRMPEGLRIGFFFLCALPSTVSSSVALTATAGGNVAAAVFNATLSALLGVVLTPLWLSAYLGAEGGGQPVGEVIVDLVKWLVLPLAVGQCIRPWLGAWAARNKKRINLVDRGTILLLVYTSFCDSVERGVWTENGWGVIAATVAGTALLLALALATTSALCRLAGFPEGDRIAAVFCGSKKTLASGVPMASLIFGQNPALGLILLPIMVYHPIQLVVGGMLAGRWARGRARVDSGPDGHEKEPEMRETQAGNDPHDLSRFLQAQEADYPTALAEIRAGRKRSHWIWYIFPQLDGLGSSSMARRYAIQSLDEARAYLAHPVLGPRLIECVEAALAVEGKSAREIFGSPDDLKLRSCATLFSMVAPAGSVFQQLLDKYFHGRPDEATQRLVAGADSA
jgi:sodium/bile acid cotransporter 7